MSGIAHEGIEHFLGTLAFQANVVANDIAFARATGGRCLVCDEPFTADDQGPYGFRLVTPTPSAGGVPFAVVPKAFGQAHAGCRSVLDYTED
jgi:hypothetical protein